MASPRPAEVGGAPDRAPGGIPSAVAGGVAGNERLIASTGMVLFVLFAVEGITVMSVHRLITPHIFVGLMLIPPIGLKLAGTGYRFTMYYAGNARYRAAGPPRPFPRIVAPFLVLCTLGLFGSGLALLVTGPHGGELWRRLHTLSFFFWFWIMSAHVLTHIWRAPGLALADMSGPRAGRPLGGALTRESIVLGSVLLGLVVAIAFISMDSSWVHWESLRHFDG